MKTMKWLVTTAFVSLGFGGCGGKTLDDGVSGGSSGSGGTAGTAGSAGFGGSVGGSGGVGGSVGGSGGVGGSIGGSGGVGGSIGGAAGGGGSGGSPGDWQAAIKSLCDQVSKIPCGMPLAECTQQLYEGVKDSEVAGCGDPYKSLIVCAAQHPITCAPGENEPIISPLCDPWIEAVTQCMEGPTPACAMSGGPGSCAIYCDAWSAQCKEQPGSGSLLCYCASGPATGKQISVIGNCGGNWTQTVEQVCAP